MNSLYENDSENAADGFFHKIDGINLDSVLSYFYPLEIVLRKFKKMIKKIFHTVYRIFSRLKFRYKLTIYIAMFGLVVGYSSFMFYTVASSNNLKNIASGIVNEWLKNNTLPPDIIETYIGQTYDEKMNSIFPFTSILKKEHISDPECNKFDIYYYSSTVNRWFRLSVDKTSGIIIKNSAGVEESLEVSGRLNSGVLSMTYPPFYDFTDNMYLWINLTRAQDRNIYIMRIISKDKEVISFLGGRYYFFIFTFLLFLLSFFLSRMIALHISKPISKLNVQTTGIAEGNLDLRTEIISKDEIGNLSASINKMAGRIKETIDSINKRMETISVMNKIDKAVLSSISRSDLIDRVTSIVSELFRDCMVALAIADYDKQKYVVLSHYIKGIKKNQGGEGTLTFSTIGEKNLEKNRTFFILDGQADREYLALLNSLIHQSYKHIMNIPVVLDEDYIGSLIVGKDVEDPFTEFEIETLKALADQTGVAMKSVKYFEEKEHLFLGILMALSKTIDEKSKWTYGHSARVTEYAGKLAVKMGMNDAFITDLKISANLHDIGKIGVPEVILDKPGKLSSDEFDIIKKHPAAGASIIEKIPGYEKFVNGILFHHEAWNGNGYPHGLEGREIPLMGRLIAVADVYDSLISDRPYRSGMSIDDTMAILLSERGKKLDPNIVDMMIEIIGDEKKGTESN